MTDLGMFGVQNMALGLPSLAGLAGSMEGVMASPGCFNNAPSIPNNTFDQFLNVTTANGLSARREYRSYVGNNYSHGTPAPLIFSYHGQGGRMGISNRFQSNADSDGWIVVAPQGMSDGNCGSGWNTGLSRSHDSNTCNSQANSGSCCYDSCAQIGGQCSGNGAGANCGWATCHSDTAFTSSMLTELGNTYCIDLNSVFAAGISNGGMVSYTMASDMPNTFRAVAPIVGLPLRGNTDVPNNFGNLAIFHLHGTNDRVIPAEGGNGGGWFYESPADVLTEYSRAAGEGGSSRTFSTPFDGGSQNFRCTNYGSSDGRFVRCLYQAGHNAPSNYEDTLFWYFKRVMDNGTGN